MFTLSALREEVNMMFFYWFCFLIIDLHCDKHSDCPILFEFVTEFWSMMSDVFVITYAGSGLAKPYFDY